MAFLSSGRGANSREQQQTVNQAVGIIPVLEDQNPFGFTGFDMGGFKLSGGEVIAVAAVGIGLLTIGGGAFGKKRKKKK